MKIENIENCNKNEVTTYFKINKEKVSEYLEKLYNKALDSFSGFDKSIDVYKRCRNLY